MDKLNIKKSEKKVYKCFVIMPFTSRDKNGNEIEGSFEKWRDIFEDIIKFGVDKFGEDNEIEFDCYRIDDRKAPDEIPDEILESLHDDFICIADLSEQNPNVFYELGLRDSWHNRTILISQTTGKTPFDKFQSRRLPYSLNKKEIEIFQSDLAESIKGILQNPDKKRNSVQKYLQRLNYQSPETIRSSSIGVTGMEEKRIALIEESNHRISNSLIGTNFSEKKITIRFCIIPESPLEEIKRDFQVRKLVEEFAQRISNTYPSFSSNRLINQPNGVQLLIKYYDFALCIECTNRGLVNLTYVQEVENRKNTDFIFFISISRILYFSLIELNRFLSTQMEYKKEFFIQFSIIGLKSLFVTLKDPEDPLYVQGEFIYESNANYIYKPEQTFNFNNFENSIEDIYNKIITNLLHQVGVPRNVEEIATGFYQKNVDEAIRFGRIKEKI